MVTKREAFLAERRNGIGGSDVAAILGLDPRKTPYQLWREKLGMDAGFSGSPATRRGNFLEPAILAAYAAKMPDATIQPNVKRNLLWRRANIDAIALTSNGGKRIVECKSVNRRVFRDEWGQEWSDEVPDRALCQGLWYADLADVPLVDFAVCVIPDDPDEVLGLTADEVMDVSTLRIFQAARNPTIERFIGVYAEAFWTTNVLEKVEPAATTIEDARLRWPIASPGKSKPVGEMASLILAYFAEGAILSDHAGIREKIREKILIYAEDAEALVDDEGKPWLTLKTQQCAAHAVDAYSSRPLRITKWWKLAHPEMTATTTETKQGAEA